MGEMLGGEKRARIWSMVQRCVLALVPALALGFLFVACGTGGDGATGDASPEVGGETPEEASGETISGDSGAFEVAPEDTREAGFVFYDAGGGWCYREGGTEKPATCGAGNTCYVVIGEPGWWLKCGSPDADVGPIVPCGRIQCGQGCGCILPEASVCACS